MLNLLRMEWYQLRRNNAYRGLLLTVCGTSALFALLSLLAPGLPNGRQAVLSAMSHAVFICLFLSFLAGKLLGADFNNRTICLQATCGRSRVILVIVKTILFIAAALPVILLYPFVTGAILTLCIGWGETIDAANILCLLQSIGLHTMAYVWICAVDALLCFCFRDVGAAMGSAIAYYILCLVLAEIELVAKASPVYWLAVFQNGAAASDAAGFFVYAAAFILGAATLSCIRFRTIDLK